MKLHTCCYTILKLLFNNALVPQQNNDFEIFEMQDALARFTDKIFKKQHR